MNSARRVTACAARASGTPSMALAPAVAGSGGAAGAQRGRVQGWRCNERCDGSAALCSELPGWCLLQFVPPNVCAGERRSKRGSGRCASAVRAQSDSKKLGGKARIQLAAHESAPGSRVQHVRLTLSGPFLPADRARSPDLYESDLAIICDRQSKIVSPVIVRLSDHQTRNTYGGQPNKPPYDPHRTKPSADHLAGVR